MDAMSLHQKQKQRQNVKQLQHLMMSSQMQQAVRLMQLSMTELALAIERELERNPVLEYDEQEESNEVENQEDSDEQALAFSENDFEIMKRLDEDFKDHFSESENYYTKRTAEEEKLKSFLEQSIPAKETLSEHLMKQSREIFQTEEEMLMAEVIIGNFDRKGYLATDLNEIAGMNGYPIRSLKRVLRQIQTFDPFGVGGSNLRECLLIHLRCRKDEKSLAYTIVKKFFFELLHNRIPTIQKKLKCSFAELEDAIYSKIAHLDTHPGMVFDDHATPYITPDASIIEDQGKLQISINEGYLPTIRLNSRYLQMLSDAHIEKETKDYVCKKLMSARWLIKNIDQRNQTIYRVVEAITSQQKAFFLHSFGKLVPMTMKLLAERLGLHESTVARAVANKYVDTPRGIFPLRYFFSSAYITADGEEMSSNAVKILLKEIIDKEDKKQPLSDDAIAKSLASKGVPCARRTIAKYRSAMKIGNRSQRRMYH